MIAVQIDRERCTGCGACVHACPEAAIEIVDGHARVAQERCQGCGACASACPQGAIIEVLAPLATRATSPVTDASAPAAEVTVKQGWLSRAAPLAAAVATFVGREVLPLIVDRMANPVPGRGSAPGDVVTYASAPQGRLQGQGHRRRQRGGRA